MDRRLYLLDPTSVRGSRLIQLRSTDDPVYHLPLLMHPVARIAIDEPRLIHLGDYPGVGSVWLFCPSLDVKKCRDQSR